MFEVKFCAICSKKFKTEKTYNDHLKSKKHKDRVNIEPVERKESIGEKKIITTLDNLNACIFCNEEASDIEE